MITSFNDKSNLVEGFNNRKLVPEAVESVFLRKEEEGDDKELSASSRN